MIIMDSSLVPEDGGQQCSSADISLGCRKMSIRAEVNDLSDLNPEKLIYGCYYQYMDPKTRNAYRMELLDDIRNGGTQRPDDLLDRQLTIDGVTFECFKDRQKFRQHFCHVALNYLDEDNQHPEPDDKKKIAPPRPRPPPPETVTTNKSHPESRVTVVGDRTGSKKNRKRKLPDIDANTRTQRKSTCDPLGNQTSAKINPFGAGIPPESSATGENVQMASPPTNTNTIPVIPVTVENPSPESSRDPVVGSPKRQMAQPVKSSEIPANVSDGREVSEDDKMTSEEAAFFPPPPIISLNQPTTVVANSNKSRFNKVPTRVKPETPPPWMELSDVFARLTPFGWQAFLFKNISEQYLKLDPYGFDYHQIKQLKRGDRMVTVDSRIIVDKFSQIDINHSNDDDSDDDDAEGVKDATADEDAEKEEDADDNHKSHDQPYKSNGMDFFLANPQIMYMVMNSSNDWKIFDHGPLLIHQLMGKDQESLKTYEEQLQEYYQDQYSIHRDREQKRKAERRASNFNTDFEHIQIQIAKQKALVAEQQMMKTAKSKNPKEKRLPNNNENPHPGAQQIVGGSNAQSQPSTSKSTTRMSIKISDLLGLKRKLSSSPPFVSESVNDMKLLKRPTKFVLRKLTGTPELLSANVPAINGIRVQRIQPKETNNTTKNNVHQKNDKRNPMMMKVHQHDDDDDVQFIHNP